MAPFFVAVYFLILESYVSTYTVLVVNNDQGVEDSSGFINHGELMTEAARTLLIESSDLPFRVKTAETRESGISRLKNKKGDALVIIPENFSETIQGQLNTQNHSEIGIEFIGDLTNIEYMVSAVWANAAISEYVGYAIQSTGTVQVTETSLGLSGSISEFDLMVPGLLILALIMLMFSATIAIVAEVENKTIIRLKLSNLSTFEFLSGVSIVQVLVGLLSILLTLAVAISMGFHHYGSMGILIIIAVLTSISIIAFSLILAAVTKTVNEVLIVGNFPLFLFMFFTGAAFPIEGKTLFHIAGYPVSFQGLMSPSHAIPALKKVMIMEMSLADVIPELIAIIVLTILYFAIGVWAFQKRHMRLK